jgi:hypothetical protein
VAKILALERLVAKHPLIYPSGYAGSQENGLVAMNSLFNHQIPIQWNIFNGDYQHIYRVPFVKTGFQDFTSFGKQ